MGVWDAKPVLVILQGCLVDLNICECGALECCLRYWSLIILGYL